MININGEKKDLFKLLRDGFGWWVSRDGRRQDYWGGATPGSKKCACGMLGNCVDPNYVSSY